jgi:hypothetical protein
MAHRRIVIAALVAGAVLAWSRSASAQSFATDGTEVRVNLPATLFTSAPADAAAPAAVAVTSVPASGEFRQIKNPSALTASLVGLYASTVTLQMLDVRSTYAVIGRGGAEGNPLMAGVVQNKGSFIALKAGLAASTILATHQLAKHHKVAAVATLVALNCAYASVVAHNFDLARQMR